MKVILIGAVNSTRVTLAKLLQHDLEVVAVLGLESANVGLVSGYVSLKEQAQESGVPFYGFSKINEQADRIVALKPDLIFVVGLSQLVSSTIINAATYGCVGFHPTKLPKGRGRAPLGWLTLDRGEGAATFFKIADGVDDGPIYVQQSFQVVDSDDAGKVSAKIQLAIEQALDRWLPEVKRGMLDAVEQDHAQATYHGIRKPADGWLDWHAGVDELLALVRSASKPHPGAYTFCGTNKIIVWKAEAEQQLAYRGVIGRVVHTGPAGEFVVQAGEQGLLRVTEYDVEGESAEWVPRVGELLGYYAEAEIHALKCQIKALLNRVGELEKQLF